MQRVSAASVHEQLRVVKERLAIEEKMWRKKFAASQVAMAKARQGRLKSREDT